MQELSTIRDCSTFAGKLDRMIELRRLLAEHPFDAVFQETVGSYLDAILLAVQGLVVNPQYADLPLRDLASWPAQHRHLAEAHNWVLTLYQHCHALDGLGAEC
jgi:hypothetical protein